MPTANWFRPPRQPIVLFLGIVLVLATALGWLGWHLLEQERALERQRIQERLNGVADLMASAILSKVAESEHHLAALLAAPNSQAVVEASRLADTISPQAILTVMIPQEVVVRPPINLPYYPIVPTLKEPPVKTFADGEKLEFKEKDLTKAAQVYRALTRSSDLAVRAGGLLRLGRTLRKAGQPSEALGVYTQLSQLGDTPVGGLPAELMAREARCALLEELKRPKDLEREGASIYADLRKGRWQLTRAAYSFYSQENRRWMRRDPASTETEQEALALAAGLHALWDEWQRTRQSAGSRAGRQCLWLGDRSVTLIWQSNADRLVGMIAKAAFVDRQWLAPLSPLAGRQNALIALTDAEGHPVAGRTVTTASASVARTPAETQLPWTLRVVSADPAAEGSDFAARRRLLMAGFFLILLLVFVVSYFVMRAVMRELEVAQLQSDFVSAVSHEFRTPLASLRQLSELLADGRVAGEDRRQRYYDGLRRETLRLHRLVENLLDFGRMEAGAHEYRMEWIDPGALVRSVSEEFGEQVRDRGYQIEIAARPNLPRVRADAEALGRALWNLLDNAVKYSPDSKTVWVDVACKTDRVAIRVRDQGLGIVPREQRNIFKKFVRAASARAAGIKGTGLGLTMVQHIVAAHGGEIRLESEPGKGSTFSILLPPA